MEEKRKKEKMVTRTFIVSYNYDILRKDESGPYLLDGTYHSETPATKSTENKLAETKGLNKGDIVLVPKEPTTAKYEMSEETFKEHAKKVEE